MINLIVIAGMQTDELSEHLEVNCAFKVVFKANSLIGAKDLIQNSILKADKLLYVYQKEQMNIRSDMAFLRELFLSDSFFEVKEVLFIQKEDEDSVQAEKYFINVMEEVSRVKAENRKYGNIIEYSYKTVQNILTFQGISEILLGVTQSAVVQNTISKFYRYEKGNSAKEVYVSDKKQGAFIEPFNFDSLINHNRERQNMDTIQSVDIQSKAEDTWKQFNDIQLDNVDVTDTKLYKNITVITGGEKTGKTTLAAALVASLSGDNSKTLLLDFTENQDCEEMIQAIGEKIQSRTVKELMLSSEICEAPIEFVNFESNDLYAIRLDVLALLLKKQLNSYENIILVTELGDLEEILYAIRENLNRLLFCMVPLKKDIFKYRDKLIMMSEEIKTLIILSERISLNMYSTYVTPEEVKNILGKKMKIVKPLELNDFSKVNGLHQAILGGDI